MIDFPNAKINLGLNIISRRSDGYHNLQTILYPIKLKDGIEIIEADEMKFETSGLPIPGFADENLCLKAYNLISADFNLPKIHIHLHKNIPIGAGLGGGSANAAFFLKLVNKKFELNISETKLEDYAKKLGADCAFFIKNKPAIAIDKGDNLQILDFNLNAYKIILAMPDIHVSTAEAYRGVKANPNKLSLIELIKLPINEWQGKIVNDFEPHIFKAYPQIRKVKELLLDAGANFALMSGSGASVFGIFETIPELAELENVAKIYKDI